MAYLRLKTRRLELIAPDLELSEAELADSALFEALSGLRLPGGWPPPLLARERQEMFLDQLRADPTAVGWRAWYFALNDECLVVGNGGFKGRADAAGMVEVGYSVMDAHQNRGYCTEAIGALIAWAFAHPEVSTVRAETTADNTASQRVMQKNSLVYVGTHDGDVRYEITRGQFER